MVRAYLNTHLPYYLNSVIVLAFIYVTEYYHRPFIVLWIVYSLVPILDQIIPDDNINPTEAEEKVLKSQIKWKVPIYTFIFLEWVTLFWSFDYINRTNMTLFQQFVLLIAVSHISAIGFLFSHELFHKRDTLGKVVGTFDMLKSLYMHFYSEHLYGHHKFVATPNDPATSKYNQSLYSFIPQTIYGTFRNCWNREEKWLAKKKKTVWSVNNTMLQWISIEIAFTLAVWAIWGTVCLIFFLFQAFFSVCLLETINYIRHYGLLRKKLKNGEYEPVTTKHSWNAPQTIQNFILLKLQRHSDHHANSFKPYQILQSCVDSPNLPCGYAVCVLASMFPYVWFNIINPLVEATNDNGKPNETQMGKSNRSLKIWLILQVSIFTAFGVVVS